eukprot:gene13374-9201_t
MLKLRSDGVHCLCLSSYIYMYIYFLFSVDSLLLSTKMAKTKSKQSSKKPKFSSKKTPQDIYGALFEAVQTEKIFPDCKTFADCELNPNFRPQTIIKKYVETKNSKGFSLEKFVEEHFILPKVEECPPRADGDNVKTYAQKLVVQSTKTSVHGTGSQLDLPHPHLIAGSANEREVQYWPSYFTLLALQELGEHEALHNMVKNFKHLLKTYGHIPSTNRSYSLSRSHPPVFALMVSMLAEIKGPEIISKYADALELEYDYFMDKTADTKHVVTLEEGVVLNRYWDQLDLPRDEFFNEDRDLAEGKPEDVARQLYRNIRSAAESGWEKSTRWLANSEDPCSIRTTDILPVDLNCLLYHLEALLTRCYREKGDKVKQDELWTASQKRRVAIDKYFFNEDLKWYTDYVVSENAKSSVKTLAGMFPFFLNIADGLRIHPVAETLEAEFLSEAGVLTTLQEGVENTWDAPMGWAPLEYATFKGLDQYGKKDLAKLVAQRWMERAHAYLEKESRFVEKFNVKLALKAPAAQLASGAPADQGAPVEQTSTEQAPNEPRAEESQANAVENLPDVVGEEGFGWAASVYCLMMKDFRLCTALCSFQHHLRPFLVGCRDSTVQKLQHHHHQTNGYVIYAGTEPIYWYSFYFTIDTTICLLPYITIPCPLASLPLLVCCTVRSLLFTQVWAALVYTRNDIQCLSPPTKLLCYARVVRMCVLASALEYLLVVLEGRAAVNPVALVGWNHDRHKCECLIRQMLQAIQKQPPGSAATMEHLAAQYRTRMQRSQRRDMVDTLLQQDGPTPNRSRAAVQYVDTTASLLRSSRGNAIQHSAQREQQLRRQKLQRELSSRRQKFSRQGYGGGGEDYCCCAPHDNERQNGYRGPSKTVRGGSAGSMKFFCCHREADGNHTRCDPCDVEIHCIYPTSKGEYSTAVPRAAPSARTSGVSPGPPPSHDHRPVAHSRKGIDKDCPACGCQLQATQLDGHEMLIDVQACPQCGLVMGRRQAQAPAADGCRSTAAPTAATGAKKGLVLKHGHKVFVSDAEYLQRRSDYMKLWEDNGLVVPVQQRGVRETAPLPQQTPRWRTYIVVIYLWFAVCVAGPASVCNRRHTSHSSHQRLTLCNAWGHCRGTFEYVVFSATRISQTFVLFIKASSQHFSATNRRGSTQRAAASFSMSTPTTGGSGRRVSDALNLDEIERILASIPDAPPAQTPAAGGETERGEREQREQLSPGPSFSDASTVATNPNVADHPPSFSARRNHPHRTQLGSSSPSGSPLKSDGPASPAGPNTITVPRLGQLLPPASRQQRLSSTGVQMHLPHPKATTENPEKKEFENSPLAQCTGNVRTGCLEVIFRESCRAPDGTPLDHAVMIPSLSIADLEQPEGLAIQSDNAVSKHECYGVQGATLEEQQALEKEDETPPISSSELPYGGHVISVKQWNPVCLQACILLIPLAFFIVVFVTQFNTIVTTSSKNVLTTGKLLATLSTYLVEEQAIAAYLGAFAARLDSPSATDAAAFYAELEDTRNKYTASQKRVNSVIGDIEAQISKHRKDLQKAMGDVDVTSFINPFQLATVRVRAVTGNENWDVMMRYENLIGDLLIFRGILMLKESIQTTSELKQTKNVFSTASLYVTKSLELYFTELGLGLQMPCPKSVYEVFYLQYVVGTTRVMERTFLFPADPSILNVFNEIAIDDLSILETRLPLDIEGAIMKMLEYTYEVENTDFYDLQHAQQLVNSVTALTDEINSMNDPLMPSIEKYRTANDYVGIVCILACFALACIGLIWHLGILVFFRSNMRLYKDANDAVLEMRASLIRMHDATMKLSHLQVNDMDSEMRLLTTKKSRIEEEERDLYIGNRTVRKLEPFLPLPMVKPPVGVPAKALLHNSLFVRPTLIRRRGIVGMRLNFSYLQAAGRDMASVYGDSLSRTNFDGNSTMNSSAMSPYASISALPGRGRGERHTQQNQREQQYYENSTLIMKFVCEVANVLLPNNKSGAYLSQCGEDAVLWINVCDRVRHPSLIAYIITACVMEFCERRNFEPPNIALCRGDAVMGNITSFTRGGAPAPREGEWTKKAIFDDQYDDGVTATGILDEDREDDNWKDFVSATEGMSTKRRLKKWLKQLFGMKTFNDADELRSADSVDTVDTLSLKKTDDAESDSEYEVPLDDELSKENKPKPEASCLTTFTIYGEVMEEMDSAQDLARSHAQNIVANERFTKSLVRDRPSAASMLNAVSSMRPATTTSALRDYSQTGSRPVSTKPIGFVSGPLGTDPHKDGGKALTSTIDTVRNILTRFMEYGVVNAPLDIIEARRRSIVVSVEEVLTAKDRRRRQKEEERHARLAQQEEAKNDTTEAPNGAADDEENRDDEVVEAEEAKAPIEVVESETDDDEPVKGFTPLNRLVDVNVSTTTVVDNHATTSKIQVDVHAFYTIVLCKATEPAQSVARTGVPSDLGSSHLGQNAHEAAMRAWQDFMLQSFMPLCFETVRQAPAIGSLNEKDAGELHQQAVESEERLQKFLGRYTSSQFSPISVLRVMDVIRTVKVMCLKGPTMPAGLQTFSPFSVEALHLCRLHAPTSLQTPYFAALEIDDAIQSGSTMGKHRYSFLCYDFFLVSYGVCFWCSIRVIIMLWDSFHLPS